MALNICELHKYTDINAAMGAYTYDEIKDICDYAIKYNCRSVTVAPYYINACFKFLVKQPQIIINSRVCAPFGADMTSVKVYAAKQAETIGAQAVEAYMNIAAFKSGNIKYVQHELETIESNTEVIFTAVVESDFLDVEQTAQAAFLAASVTPFVKILGSLSKFDDFIHKVKSAYDLSAGCIQITAECKDFTLNKISELKNAGAEYFSVEPNDLELLFNETDFKEPEKST